MQDSLQQDQASVGLCVRAVVTGAGRGQLECLDGEREIVIVRVVHQESEKANKYFNVLILS